MEEEKVLCCGTSSTNKQARNPGKASNEDTDTEFLFAEGANGKCGNVDFKFELHLRMSIKTI